MQVLIMLCCLPLSDAETELHLNTDRSVDAGKVITSFFYGHQTQLGTADKATGLIIIKENYIPTSQG